MEKTQVVVSDVYVVDQATKEETRVFGEMTFGRAEGDKLYPEDAQISRKHFRLIQAQDEVIVEDLGSTNRTKVNGTVLKPGVSYKLRSRDIVEFGRQKIQVFIGGKIVADPKAIAAADLMAEPEQQQERSMVFERFCSADMIAPAPGFDGGKGVELNNEAGEPLEFVKKDDAVVESLVRKKNAAWYLQFGGSEFGPLSLKELKVIVSSKQFQGGALYAFTEGLANWLPVEKLLGILELPASEFTATQQIGSWIKLSGAVHCFTHPTSGEKISGSCEFVSLAELTIRLPQALPPQLTMLEIEVSPDLKSGIEKFRAMVKVDPSRSGNGTYTLLFVQAKPSTKIAIERYLRSQP